MTRKAQVLAAIQSGATKLRGIALMTGMNRDYLAQTVRALIEDGSIVRTGYGTYALYRKADPAPMVLPSSIAQPSRARLMGSR